MSSADLKARIETIEAGYEYMLAYAAQGFERNVASSHQQEIIRHLTNMDAALTGLTEVTSAAAHAVDGDADHGYQAVLQALAQDASKAQGAIRLVMSRDGISSQLIDNLNASIHLRALLTDLFLIDEALT